MVYFALQDGSPLRGKLGGELSALTGLLQYINADGSGVVQLTDDGSVKLSPDWSPKNQIAFEDGQGRIIIAEI